MARRTFQNDFSSFKLPSGIAVLLASYLISVRSAVFLNIHFSFVLAALIALSFFFGSWELVLLAAMSAFFLNWAPSASAEILFLIAIPILGSLCRKAFPVIEGWFGNIVLIAFGILAFYYASDFGFAFSHMALVAEDATISAAFGTAAFAIFSGIYGERTSSSLRHEKRTRFIR
ncbi:MAG: hypothetical protein AAB967_00985 [Patescibacteria group bacterium]